MQSICSGLFLAKCVLPELPPDPPRFPNELNISDRPPLLDPPTKMIKFHYYSSSISTARKNSPEPPRLPNELRISERPPVPPEPPVARNNTINLLELLINKERILPELPPEPPRFPNEFKISDKPPPLDPPTKMLEFHYCSFPI